MRESVPRPVSLNSQSSGLKLHSSFPAATSLSIEGVISDYGRVLPTHLVVSAIA